MWPFSRSCQSKARLVGKTVIVTGANCGIGKETARDLYRRGARVILACRDVTKANAAVEDLKNNPPSRPTREQYQGGPGELAVYPLNLCSLASVRKCAKSLLRNESNIHILINNAGVMMCPFDKTEDGFEIQFQSNYLGHFLLTLLLLPKMQASSPGCRIVNVSSMAHSNAFASIYFDDLNLEKSYTPLKAYGQSKLANVLFSAELARRLKEANIDGINVYSLHPGVVTTELGRHFDSTVFSGARTIFRLVFSQIGKNPEQGAQTSIYCAVDEKSANETGLYYKECGVSTPSTKARNVQIAKDLWNRTIQLLNMEVKESLDKQLEEAARQISSANTSETEN